LRLKEAADENRADQQKRRPAFLTPISHVE